MKILVLGATGRVGSHLVSNALRSNHHVTALVRSPEKVQINDDNFVLHQGNALVKRIFITPYRVWISLLVP